MAHVGSSLNVRSRVSLDTKSLEALLLRTEETKRKQHKLGGVELHDASDRFSILETSTKTDFL